jgi:CheY-like chemotaxis protein
MPVVLAADDDEDAHFLLTRAFIKAGVRARVVTVNDGDGVIEYLSGAGKFADREAFPLPQLLLLDLKMRQCPGFAVLEYIGKHRPLKGFPVVVLSSSESDADVNKAYALGCHSYVSKPGSFDELVRFVTLLEEAFLDVNETPEPADRPLSGFSHFREPTQGTVQGAASKL